MNNIKDIDELDHIPLSRGEKWFVNSVLVAIFAGVAYFVWGWSTWLARYSC